MTGRAGLAVKPLVALIPRSEPGASPDQSVFKMAFTIRYEKGETKRDAVDNATVDVRRGGSPDFVPRLLDGFWLA